MVSAVPKTTSGFLPGQARSRIGADIGTRMLKFAQCRRVFGTWKVSAVHIQPVISQQIADATGLGRGVVADSLSRTSFRSHGFPDKSVVAALSSAVVSPRPLELPDGDEDELAEMVSAECDASESSPVDFWRTRRDADNQDEMARVNAVVLPKELAFHCAEGLRRAGLYCDAISVQSMALARSTQLMDAGDRPVAAVDWGASAPMLCICRNGQPEFSRVLRHCGLRTAVEEISTDMGIGELESAQLLAAYGVDSSRRTSGTIGSRLDALLTNHVDRFQQELARTLEFIDQNQPESMPEWICLFGGGATISGISSRLTDELHLETRRWELEPSQLDPGLRELEFQSMFGAAVGLSILETDK